MKSNVSLTNHSFSMLEGSSGFLHEVLNNINSCVLLLDREMKLRAFNEPMKTIFSNKKDEDLLYQRCGNAIGCAYQIEAGVECGETNHCNKCELRIASMESYIHNIPVFKEHVKRPFFTYENEKVYKDLQFSTRLFEFGGEKFIILLVEDITNLIAYKELKEKIKVE